MDGGVRGGGGGEAVFMFSSGYFSEIKPAVNRSTSETDVGVFLPGGLAYKKMACLCI